jgi:hypothetical protein
MPQILVVRDAGRQQMLIIQISLVNKLVVSN